MKSPLRWLGLASLGFVLLHPGSVLAQTVTDATKDKLVGTWLTVYTVPRGDRRVKPVVREVMLALAADGTYQMQVKEDGVQLAGDSANWGAGRRGGKGSGHWELTGDQFYFDPATIKVDRRQRKNWAHEAILRDGQLFIGQYHIPLNACSEQHAVKFKSVDPSKPLPPSTLPAPQPPTLKRADLVGTWVVAYDSIRSDTLTLRPDSTWSSPRVVFMDSVGAENGKAIRKPITASGEWYLLPGDSLWLPQRTAFGNVNYGGGDGGIAAPKVILKDPQQFALVQGCNGHELVYKRIKP